MAVDLLTDGESTKRARTRGRVTPDDFLGNFSPQPAREPKTAHAVDRYLEVIKPLGIANVPRSTV